MKSSIYEGYMENAFGILFRAGVKVDCSESGNPIFANGDGCYFANFDLSKPQIVSVSKWILDIVQNNFDLPCTKHEDILMKLVDASDLEDLNDGMERFCREVFNIYFKFETEGISDKIIRWDFIKGGKHSSLKEYMG